MQGAGNRARGAAGSSGMMTRKRAQVSSRAADAAAGREPKAGKRRATRRAAAADAGPNAEVRLDATQSTRNYTLCLALIPACGSACFCDVHFWTLKWP
jgi:hypothetical protein